MREEIVKNISIFTTSFNKKIREEENTLFIKFDIFNYIKKNNQIKDMNNIHFI